MEFKIPSYRPPKYKFPTFRTPKTRLEIVNPYESKKTERRPFSTTTKREALRLTHKKCKRCGKKLTRCRGRPFGVICDFDHRDNNPANNHLKNCGVLCPECHRKVTVLGKRATYNMIGVRTGYKTIKKKVGYKKQHQGKKKRAHRRRLRRPNVLGGSYNFGGFDKRFDLR